MSGGPFGSKPWASRSCRVQRCHVLIVSTTHTQHKLVTRQRHIHTKLQPLSRTRPRDSRTHSVLSFNVWPMTSDCIDIPRSSRLTHHKYPSLLRPLRLISASSSSSDCYNKFLAWLEWLLLLCMILPSRCEF